MLDALIWKRKVPPHLLTGTGDVWVGNAGIGV